MPLRSQFLITLGIAFGSLLVLLIMGRVRLKDAVDDGASLVDRQFNPLVLENAPRLQQTYEGLTSLLTAMRGAHEARMAQLRAVNLATPTELVSLAAKGEASLQEMVATMALAQQALPYRIQTEWDRHEPVLIAWIEEERAVMALTRELAVELAARNQQRQESQQAFDPFRRSLDHLGEQIEALLEREKGAEELLVAGTALGLVLNANRDAFQALVAEKSIALLTEAQSEQFEALAQEHRENLDQIADRLERARAMLSSPAIGTTFENAGRLYQDWRPASMRTVATTEGLLERLAGRQRHMMASSTHFDSIQSWLERSHAALKDLATEELASFEDAREEAMLLSATNQELAGTYIGLFNLLSATALLSFALLLVFQGRLVAALESLSLYLAKLDPSKMKRPFRMPSQRLIPSVELQTLETNLNAMRERLVQTMEQHHNAIAQLSASEALYSSLFHNVFSPMILVDPDSGRIVDANEAAARLYGCPIHALEGSFIDQLDEKDGDSTLYAQLKAIEPGSGAVLASRQRRGDSTTFDAEFYAGRVRGESGDVLLLVARDITQKVEFQQQLLDAKEKAEAANAAKDDFLSVMSHELRTPLNPIVGFAELMAQTEDPTVCQYADAILKSARRMLGIVESILFFTQLDRSSQKLSSERFCLEDILEEPRAISLLHGRETAVSIRNGDPAGGLLPIPDDLVMRGARDAIVQAMMNLLHNALKYAFPAPIELVLGIERNVSPREAALRIEVRDQGPGVPESFRDQLFDPFTQAESSLARSFEGIGLGLAICRKLAALMGGAIGHRPNLPNGAVFWLAFPVVTLVSSPNGQAHRTARKPDSKTHELAAAGFVGRPRVLVVEDNEDNAAYLKFALREMGAEVDHVADGLSAISQCEKNSFDVVLIDITMHGIDGFETLKRLQSLPGFSARAECLALTAHATEEMRNRCLNAGFSAYLAKPVRPNDLKNCLQSLASF